MNRAHRRRDKRRARGREATSDLDSRLERALDHHRSGRLVEARQVYEQILRQDPDNARALFLMGTLAAQQRDYQVAESFVRRAIEANSREASYHNNLGIILREAGRLEEALTSYRSAIELRPDYAEAYCNLGIALKELGRAEEAVPPLEKAIELAPDFGGAYSSLGNALHVLGRPDAAMEAFDRAVALVPADASVLFNRAITRQDLGELDAAQSDFRKVLRIQPQHGEAWRLLSGLKRFASAEDKDIVEMSRVLRANSTAESATMHLHFGLGKALADVGENDSAFEHFAKANSIYRRTYDYDVAKDAEYFELIREAFSAEFLSDRKDWGSASARPVFIIGMMRSGTSLVEQILASHPQVVGCGELQELDQLTRRVEARPLNLDFPQSVLHYDNERARRLGEAYLQALSQRVGSAKRATDKMPGNFQYVGLLHLLLPRATIIHCVRNPVDTCLSCFRNYFAGFHPFAYDLAELGQYYRLYQGLMKHWRDVVPNKLQEICYEDLVADPEAQIRRLLEICGLDWDDRCLEFHQTERSVRTASAAQIRQPMYTSSVESWRKFEGHVGPLLERIG